MTGERLRTGAGWLLVLVMLVYLGLFLALVVGGATIDFHLLGVHVHAKDPGKLVTIGFLAAFLRLLLALEKENALLLSGSVLFGLLCGEAALRVLDHPLASLGKVKQIHGPSKACGFGNVAGTRGTSAMGHPIRINSRGLRDREREGKRPVGQKRILVLGDSFVFGMGVDVEDTFHQQLEGLLEAKGKPTDAVNAGVVGYNLFRSLRYLEAEGEHYAPDLVLFAYFADDVRPPHTPEEIEKDYKAWQAYTSTPPKPEGGSYLLRFLKNFNNLLWKGRFRAFAGRGWVRNLEARVEAIAGLEDFRGPFAGTTDAGPFREEFARLVERTRALGAKLVVLAIPDAAQLRKPEWQAPQRLMAELCEKHGVALVDALPRFEEEADPADLYLFPYDAHTSPAGHRVMAELLAERILSDGLL